MRIRKQVNISEEKKLTSYVLEDSITSLANAWKKGHLVFPRSRKCTCLPPTKEFKQEELNKVFMKSLELFLASFFAPGFDRTIKETKIKAAKEWIFANAKELIHGCKNTLGASKNLVDLFFLAVQEDNERKERVICVTKQSKNVETIQREKATLSFSDAKSEEKTAELVETFDLDGTLFNVDTYGPQINPELLAQLYWCHANDIPYFLNTNRTLTKSIQKLIEKLATLKAAEEEKEQKVEANFANESLYLPVEQLHELGLTNLKICTPGDPKENSDFNYAFTIFDYEKKLIEKLKTMSFSDARFWLETLLAVRKQTDHKNEDQLESEIIQQLLIEKKWPETHGENWKQPQALFIAKRLSQQSVCSIHWDDDEENVDYMEIDPQLGLPTNENGHQVVPFQLVRKSEDVTPFIQSASLLGLEAFTEKFIDLYVSDKDKKTLDLKELAAVFHFIQTRPDDPKIATLISKIDYKQLKPLQLNALCELISVRVLKISRIPERKVFIKNFKLLQKKIVTHFANKTASQQSKANTSLRGLFKSARKITQFGDIIDPNQKNLKDFLEQKYGRTFNGSKLGVYFNELLNNATLMPEKDLDFDYDSEDWLQELTTINKYSSLDDLYLYKHIPFANINKWVKTLSEFYSISYSYLANSVTNNPSPELIEYFGAEQLNKAINIKGEKHLQVAMLTSITEIAAETITEKFPQHKQIANLLFRLVNKQNIIFKEAREAVDELLEEKISDLAVSAQLKRIYAITNKYIEELFTTPLFYKHLPLFTQLLKNAKEWAKQGDINKLQSFDLNQIKLKLFERKTEDKKTEVKHAQRQSLVNKLITKKVEPDFKKPAIASGSATLIGGGFLTPKVLIAVGVFTASQQVIPVWGQIVATVVLAVGVISLLATGILKLCSLISERRQNKVQQSEPVIKDGLEKAKSTLVPSLHPSLTRFVQPQPQPSQEVTITPESKQPVPKEERTFSSPSVQHEFSPRTISGPRLG